MQDKILFDKIKKSISKLDGIEKEGVAEYFKTLIEPEKYSDIRIPSKIRLPSITFQKRYIRRVMSSQYGFFAFSFNPWFLVANNIEDALLRVIGKNPILVRLQWLSTMWSNDDSGRTGYETLSDIGQVDPVNLYNDIPLIINAYRLVSASLKVKWLYKPNIVSGVYKGGICFDKNIYVGGRDKFDTTSRYAGLDEDMRRLLSNGQNIENLEYHRCNPVLEGLRLLYFPTDNSMLEYKKLLTRSNIDALKIYQIDGFTRKYYKLNSDYWNPGFNWVVCMLEGYPYVVDATEIEICCNFEGLLTTECLSYIPQEIEQKGITLKTLSAIIEILRDICLQDSKGITFDLINSIVKINNINNI